MKSDLIKRNFLSHKKPQGEITRGKTAPGRLRRTDLLMSLYDPFLFSVNSIVPGYYVDLGYGHTPLTTIESYHYFSSLNQNLIFLGVEIDPVRVRNAQPFTKERLMFRCGGFNLPVNNSEPVRYIRAFNVLRQYHENDVNDAYEMMASYLSPGGIILDGTSNPSGTIWTANIIRKHKAGYKEEALVFSYSGKEEFSPDIFPPYLIKKWIHKMGDESPVRAFFDQFRFSYKQSLMFPGGSKRKFVKSAFYLKEFSNVCCRKRFLNRGYLIWWYPS